MHTVVCCILVGVQPKYFGELIINSLENSLLRLILPLRSDRAINFLPEFLTCGEEAMFVYDEKSIRDKKNIEKREGRRREKEEEKLAIQPK